MKRAMNVAVVVTAIAAVLLGARLYARPAATEHLWGYRITKAGTQQVVVSGGGYVSSSDAMWSGEQAALGISTYGAYELTLTLEVKPE